MKTDRHDFPTFLRLARVLTDRTRRILRWAGSRPTWIRLAQRALAVGALALTGYLAARLSTSACREAIVRRVEASDPSHAPHSWTPESELVPVRLPDDYRPGRYPAGPAPGSLGAWFVPDHVWLSAGPPHPADGAAHSWALVRVRAVGPFLLRAHFAYGHWVTREWFPGGPTLRAGQDAFGATLFVGAFGFVYPVHDWTAGGTFN